MDVLLEGCDEICDSRRCRYPYCFSHRDIYLVLYRFDGVRAESETYFLDTQSCSRLLLTSSHYHAPFLNIKGGSEISR